MQSLLALVHRLHRAGRGDGGTDDGEEDGEQVDPDVETASSSTSPVPGASALDPVSFFKSGGTARWSRTTDAIKFDTNIIILI